MASSPAEFGPRGLAAALALRASSSIPASYAVPPTDGGQHVRGCWGSALIAPPFSPKRLWPTNGYRGEYALRRLTAKVVEATVRTKRTTRSAYAESRALGETPAAMMVGETAAAAAGEAAAVTAGEAAVVTVEERETRCVVVVSIEKEQCEMFPTDWPREGSTHVRLTLRPTPTSPEILPGSSGYVEEQYTLVHVYTSILFSAQCTSILFSVQYVYYSVYSTCILFNVQYTTIVYSCSDPYLHGVMETVATHIRTLGMYYHTEKWHISPS